MCQEEAREIGGIRKPQPKADFLNRDLREKQFPLGFVDQLSVDQHLDIAAGKLLDDAVKVGRRYPEFACIECRWFVRPKMLVDQARQPAQTALVFACAILVVPAGGNARGQPQRHSQIRFAKIRRSGSPRSRFRRQPVQRRGGIGTVHVRLRQRCQPGIGQPFSKPGVIPGHRLKMRSQDSEDITIYIPGKAEAVARKGRNGDDGRRDDRVDLAAKDGVARTRFDVQNLKELLVPM